MPKTTIIQPQKGFQEKFVRSNVDFAVGGGVLNCGKAQPLYSNVLTPTGFVAMGSLKVGDTISNPDGGVQTVERIFERGLLDNYKVEFDDGTSVECCDEHLWLVWDKYTNAYKVLELSIIIAKGIKRYSFPLCSSIYYKTEEKELPIDPYLLGLLLGDGHICKTANSSITITTDFANIERAYSRKEFDYVYHKYAYRYNYVTVTDKDVRRKLKELGYFGTLSHTKFIPEIYKKSSIEDRLELIRGLIDTDGYVDKRSSRIEYTTTSKQLCDDVCDLVRSLGAKVSVCEKIGAYTKNGAKVICKKVYRLSIRHYNIESLFTLGRKKTGRAPQKKIMKSIKNVFLCGKQQMRCIVVSGDSHTYITDGYNVTHNTFSAVMSVAEPSEDPKFRALFLRNNLGDARASGGILDTFAECYGAGVKIVESGEPRVTFPSGAKCDVTHVSDQSYDKVMQRFKGRQFDFIYFDEGTGFTWECFTAIYTRNRGKGKWTGKVRMTTNPERDHWLRAFLDWYIGPDGYIRKDRDGKIRYFYMAGPTVKDVVWGNSKEEVYMQCKPDIDAKLKSMNEEEKEGFFTWKDIIQSFTFYLGKMSENKASIGNNPGYIGAVAMTGGAVSKQLLEGNWNVSTKHDGDAPIKLENINKVLQNDPQRNGDRWVTCDLADTGTDNFIALAWDGFHIEDILILSKSTPKMNADYLRMFAAEHDVPDNHIIYDAVRGTYMNDYIPDATPFVSYRAPIGLYGRMAMKLKDECYMRLAEVIKKDMLSFSDKVANKQYEHQMLKERIAVSAEFIEECSVVRFTERSSGKKSLLTKKEMNAKLGKSRSMDLLDPCAMRMLPVLQYPYGEELFRTSKAILDREDDETSDNLVDVYDESNWY